MSEALPRKALALEGIALKSRPWWHELTRCLFVLGQLALLAVVIRQFQIESSAFLRLFLLAGAGFAVHYFLPSAWRMPFFVGLSLTAILMILGVTTGVTLVAIGMVLIGICHIPIAWRWRIALLLGVAALLAYFRTELIDLPWTHALWPILGSMFMFRLIVYVYDFRHERTPPDFWSSLGYFFMLPNVCFPLFPVVDYKTFRRQQTAGSLFEVANLGATWIIRGVAHLVLYRIVYYYFTLSPDEVVDADSLVQFLVANFLLYLRISGYFHLIIGMLHLFGFGLPETHHRYVLSSSFTEFWRRINIYWKDFMMKVLYLPLYFRLRRFGDVNALIIATMLVFIGTWAAHSYQWFWLRGNFPIIWQDIVFWGALAVLVTINSVYEIKRGRKRSLSAAWSVKDQLVLGLKTVVTFFAIIVLWSLWTSDSFGTWLAMWSFPAADGDGAENSGFPLYLTLVAVAVFAGAILFGRERKAADARSATLFEWLGVAVTGVTLRSLILLGALFLVSLPQIYMALGTTAANFVISLRSDTLSRVDAAELQRGYYEDLTRVDRFNSKLWEVYMKRPAGWLDATGSGLTRFTGDFQGTHLIPSYRATTSFSVITTNRWGMRDQEYELVPEPDTYRIAMLGASNVMGWGVEDDETFESVLERALNERMMDDRWARFESLNFGVPGYYPLQQRPALDRALTFSPTAIVYVATGRELSRASYYLAQTWTEGVDIPYPALIDVGRRAELGQATGQSDAVRRLRPFSAEVLEWLYRELATTALQHGAQPILVFLPQLDRGPWEEETPETLRLARDAGFHVFDLTGIYDDYEGNLAIAEWDNHPNAIGHRMIAERLFHILQTNWQDLRTPPGE
jgi:D-alanyl-lipoteichoic acid acyltransferase DltB (MBOAT superfamily)